LEEKECLECGRKIFGRADKKFCSDLCRNNHNNKLNSSNNQLIRQTNNTLKKNRKILKSLNPKGKSKVPKSKLMEKGFDFNYLTSIYKTKAGATYYFCYEYGYLPIDNDWYALVIKKEYAD